MTFADLDAVIDTTDEAFRELSQRSGHVAGAPSAARRALHHRRRLHLLETDPDGQWLAVDDADRVLGVSSALRRDRLWGLSLLVVHPSAQGAGIGRTLLDAALGLARDGDAGLILSSSDPAAMRRYARAGFALRPTLSALGRPRDVIRPAGVRDGGVDDVAATEPVDLVVRGAARSGDIADWVSSGVRFFVSDAGYALSEPGRLITLAALDPAAAADLLRAVLAAAEGETQVNFMTAEQGWAIPVLLDAGLILRPDGPVCVRGPAGALAPYIPSGVYL
jgi:GNAT superfamily N-acetyltransferase